MEIDRNRSARDWVKEKKYLLRPAIILSIIYIIAISAIIRADVLYLDDVWRAMEGTKGWDFFSRYLSNFLSVFIHAENYLTDVSPMPQILAALIMGITSALALSILTGREEFSVWDYIAVLPLGLSPYFLECFSYRYDAPYMAVSVFFSVAPLIFANTSIYAFCLATVLGTLGMCTTYQASSGIFPMMMIALLFRQWTQGEEKGRLIRLAASSAGSYGAALLFFRIFLMHYVDDYVSVAISRNGFLSYVLRNYKDYYTAVVLDFRKEWLALICLILLLFVVYETVRSRRNRFATAIIALLSLFSLLLLAFGVYPFLKAPLFAPRAMYGIGALVAVAAVIACDGKHPWLARLSCLALSWSFFVFAFTYGNALSVQEEYSRFRMESVISDLTDIPEFSEAESVCLQLEGSIGYAPQIRHYPQNYRMLRDLVPITFQDSWRWGEYTFYNVYDLWNVHTDSDTDLTKENLVLLKESIYHTIYGDENNFLVVLKDPEN
ncbi:MAG: glucosyltransferase domain-containing protein [Oscillospiraceae bacterium]|nr:glucosyltransferase domain-containing protein [Oscillospiraceae bacterium]